MVASKLMSSQLIGLLFMELMTGMFVHIRSIDTKLQRLQAEAQRYETWMGLGQKHPIQISNGNHPSFPFFHL